MWHFTDNLIQFLHLNIESTAIKVTNKKINNLQYFLHFTSNKSKNRHQNLKC
jgi:hypothetical protein